MTVTLNASQVFWGLMHPTSMKITNILTEGNTSTTIDETQLEQWAIKQIAESVKKNKISISVQLEELLKLDKTAVAPLVKEKIKKSPALRKQATSKE